MAISITGYFDNEGSETGFFTSGGPTDDISPELRGTVTTPLNPGDSVYIMRNGTGLGMAAVDSTAGTWSFQDSNLVDGQTYNYTAMVLTGGLPSAMSNSYAITVNAGAPPLPPAAPTVITIDQIMDNVVPITGPVTNGMHTNDATPTVSGSGAGPNSTVNIYDNTHIIGSTTADGDGNWTYTPADADKLGEGGHSLTATYVDAGVESQHSSAVTFTVDTVAPAAQATISAIVEDTNFPNDFITSDNTLVVTATVNGLVEVGEKVQITTDDGATWHDATLVSGNTYQYDMTSTPLTDGIYGFRAQVIDLAGNVSQISQGQAVIIDTVAPTAVATISAIDQDTGASATDFVTADNTLVVTATVNGTVGFYDRVQISLDDGATWHYTQRINSDTFQYNATGTPLDDGTYTFQARLIDVAGNIGTVITNQHVVIDTEAPTAMAAISAIIDDTGISTTDFVTNDRTLLVNATVTGTVASDETVQISLNGGVTWNDATLLSGNTWQYDATGTPLAENTYTFEARVIDLAGNLGAATPQTVVIDTTPPAAANITINTIAGNDVLDATEAKGNVTITGTLTNVPDDAVSQELTVKVGNTDYVATVNGTTWSITVPGSELVNATVNGGHGDVVANLTLADAAGNTTLVTEDRSYLLRIEPTVAKTYTVGTAYAGLGYAMTAITDFNGDGYTDYIVTAPGNHYGNYLCCGKSVEYLLYGGPNGLPDVSNLDTITAAQGIRITGAAAKDLGLQGFTVSNIGDFNGDGLSDVSISSNLNDTTFVLLGHAGNNIQTLDLSKLTPAQGFSVQVAGCWSPWGSTGADMNGDGYSDLMFSYVDASCGKGEVFTIYGHAGAQGNITYTETTVKGAVAGYNIAVGANSLGTSLSSVGDVNGDGYADYVATMPGVYGSGGSIAGSAYLVFGGPGGITQASTKITDLTKMNSGQGITIKASNYYEHLGGQAGIGGENMQADAMYAEYHSVASLGNIDGSGRNAFAIGSPGASPNNGKSTSSFTCGTVSDGAGAVYVMYGQDNWSNLTLPTWSSTTKQWSGGSLNGTDGFVIYSSSFANTANGKLANASDLGFAVDTVGDVNGDGIDDFMIGAPAAYNGKGAAYLVFGEAGGLPGANTGVVDLDQLVAAGKISAIGAAGTAMEYVGKQATGLGCCAAGSNLGTDVTGGDFSGTGINGYAFGAWGQNSSVTTTSTNACTGKTSTTTKVLAQAGEVYTYDGITTFLTQEISNADNAVYYAGTSQPGAMHVQNGVDLIATGSGNHDWVHGIGTDTTGSASLTIQHDAVNGGRGDDHIGIIGTNFTSINGGNGWDTLVFEGSNIKLNLADMGLRVQGFEQFDLNNQSNTAATDPHGLFTGLTTGNTLELRLSDVLSQGDAVSPSGQHMTILGDNTSSVLLDGSGWATSSTQMVGGVSFDVWHNSSMGTNTAADVLVQHGVSVNGIQGAPAPILAISPTSASLLTTSGEDAAMTTASTSGNDTQSNTGKDVLTFTATDGSNHAFTSSSGDDVFNLQAGGNDTLLYKLIDSANAGGGNGHDQVNGFTVGAWGTTDAAADRIDLSNLLQGYKPATAATGATADSGKPADATSATVDTGTTADASKAADSAQLTQYLSVSHDNNNTTVNVDVHGTGQYAAVVTLNNVDVSLETLLANNQIVV